MSQPALAHGGATYALPGLADESPNAGYLNGFLPCAVNDDAFRTGLDFLLEGYRAGWIDHS